MVSGSDGDSSCRDCAASKEGRCGGLLGSSAADEKGVQVVLSETATSVRRQGWLYILFGLEGLKRGAHARVAAHVGGAASGTSRLAAGGRRKGGMMQGLLRGHCSRDCWGRKSLSKEDRDIRGGVLGGGGWGGDGKVDSFFFFFVIAFY